MVNTDFLGSLDFAANTLVAGTVIRITAWGNYVNAATTGSTWDLQLFFNPGAALMGPVADSGQHNLPGGTATGEWYFSAQITIRTTGATGTTYCDSWFLNPPPLTPLVYYYMCGSGSFSIDTTVANDLELAAVIGAQFGFTLTQCTIEKMAPP